MVDSVNLRLELTPAGMLGFRHGLDYDHIAAISDISSIQSKASDAMRYGLLYVAGHATTVAVLGAAAITFRISYAVFCLKKKKMVRILPIVGFGVYILCLFFLEGGFIDFRPMNMTG